ncbi:patatin-like phospholipase family protein [Rhodobium gokarnense]|uniref:PNPLA domain-containing protein n=1 Tax=Rhodobium gokarnense TaxID=364296 RepID=A0ABT3H6R5_9HYPH|nr:patatin-like phospholipase family protein [Rhodobium gokarnense]MCW2306081.1 hypothetical protein [Rhodobium gokarnense]
MPSRLSGPVLCLLAAAALLAGCASLPERTAVPENAVGIASVSGYAADDKIRYWADDRLSVSERAEWRKLYVAAAQKRNRAIANYLVLSGGGGDGAFGAGFLTGWTEAGTRPEFDIVTGISIGALVAPYAFIGSSEDPELQGMFAGFDGYDFYAKENIQKVIVGEVQSDDNPLRRDVEKRVTDELLDAVAAEYARGRLLFVGTTNLDAQRTVMWNLGAIAASNRPDRRELFVDVLLAAASIPVVLPAVPITVKAGNASYVELHVDAGTQTEAFFAPPQVSMRDVDRALGRERRHNLYIIRNDKLAPEYSAIENEPFDIARRSLSTLLKAHAVADLYRIYTIAQRDGVAYRMASIPAGTKTGTLGEFDPKRLKKLFVLGRDLARKGYAWKRKPPGLRTH